MSKLATLSFALSLLVLSVRALPLQVRETKRGEDNFHVWPHVLPLLSLAPLSFTFLPTQVELGFFVSI